MNITNVLLREKPFTRVVRFHSQKTQRKTDLRVGSSHKGGGVRTDKKGYDVPFRKTVKCGDMDVHPVKLIKLCTLLYVTTYVCIVCKVN